ncbi:unnamed protein product [Absidia cylindrospora]
MARSASVEKLFRLLCLLGVTCRVHSGYFRKVVDVCQKLFYDGCQHRQLSRAADTLATCRNCPGRENTVLSHSGVSWQRLQDIQSVLTTAILYSSLPYTSSLRNNDHPIAVDK